MVEIGLAAGQQIRPRLSKEVLHAIGDEPSRDYGQGEAQQASVQLPELALPNQRFWRPRGDRRTGDKDEADNGDDDDRGEDGDDCCQPDRDRLMYSEWKATGLSESKGYIQEVQSRSVNLRDVAVVEGKRPLI